MCVCMLQHFHDFCVMLSCLLVSSDGFMCRSFLALKALVAVADLPRLFACACNGAFIGRRVPRAQS